ncbi:MAG: PAS domain S-box protein [Candidatus Zixiibacteriota bacterium]
MLYRRWHRASKRESELSNIIESISPDVLIVIDSNRTVTMCNGSIERMFGLTVDEILGKKTDRLYFDRRNNPNDSGEIYEILESEGFHLGLATGIKANGKTFPLEIITGNLTGIEGAVLLLRDISARVEAQQQLIASEKRFRDLFESSPDPILVTDEKTRIIDVNPAACKLYSRNRSELIGNNFYDLVPVKFASHARKNYSLLLENKISFMESYIIDKNGFTIPVEAASSKLDFFEGNAYLLHLRDITIRLANERALEKEKEFIQAILNNSYDGIAVINIRGEVLMLSPSMKKLFGYELDEIPTVQSWVDKCFITEHGRNTMLDLMEKAREKEKLSEKIFLVANKNGKRRWLKFHMSMMDDENIVVNGQDITEGKIIEQQLKESEAKYRQVVERANDGILIIQDRTIKYCNERLGEIIRYDTDEIEESFFDYFIAEDKREEVLSFYKSRIAGEEIPARYETDLIDKEGERVPVEVNAGTFVYNDRIADLVFIKDITEQKLAEADIEYHHNFEKMVSNISTNFIHLNSDEIDEGIHEALAKVGEFSGVDRSYLFLITDDKKHFSNTHEWCREDIEPQIDHLQNLLLDEFPWLKKKLFEKCDIFIPDIDMLPKEAENLRRILNVQSIKSLVMVPMVFKNDLMGFIGFDAVRDYMSWNSKDKDLLRMIAEIFVNALVGKSNEEALRSSEERYRLIINSAHDIIWTLDKCAKLTFINSRGTDLTGYDFDEWIGKELGELIHPADLDTFNKICQNTLDGNSNTFELRIVGKYGETYNLLVDSLPIFEDDMVVGTVNFARDITVRKHAQRELAKSREYYRNLFQSSPLGIITFDAKGEFSDANSRIIEMLGLTETDYDVRVEYIKKNFMNKTGLIDAFWECLERDKMIEVESKYQARDIDSYYHVRVVPLHAPKESISGALFIVEDVTERKKAEKALQYSEERYRTLQENVPVGVFRSTIDGRIITANPAMAKLFGYENVEQFISTSANETYFDSKQRDQYLERLKDVGSVVDFETVLLKKDGSSFWVSISAKAIYNEKARLKFIDGIMKDITDVKHAREALKASELQYRTTINSMDYKIFLVDSELKIIMHNKTLVEWAKELNLPFANDILGKTVMDIFDFKADQIKEEYEHVFQTGKPHIIEEIEYFDHKRIITETRKIPVFESGKVVRTITIIQDITKRKEAEEELRVLATTDALTGTLNRRSGIEVLDNEIKESRKKNYSFTVCYLDVNKLKLINDNFGHIDGDKVLMNIARIVKENLRDNDSILRMGGDEFLLILPQADMEDAMRIWEKIDEGFDRFNKKSSKPYEITISHGFAMYSPNQDIPVDQIIADADAAMYRNKKND